jgi:hypothetical protein
VAMYFLAVGGANIAAEPQTPVVIDQLQVFPIGWMSEGEVSKAKNAVRFEAGANFRIDNTDVLFVAPFPGRLSDADENYVLEGRSVRALYPKRQNASATLGEVKRGEPIVRYRDAVGQTFLFFLRHLDLPASVGFADGVLNATTNGPLGVFSLTSGDLQIVPIAFADETVTQVLLIGDSMLVSYTGLTGPFTSNRSSVPAGTEIGRSGLESMGYWVMVEMYGPNNEKLKPDIIYFVSKY